MAAARIQERSLVTARLKSIASKLPKEHPLRQVLMVEADEMEREEFLAKLRTWMRLLALG
jgi:hypothetical protein